MIATRCGRCSVDLRGAIARRGPLITSCKSAQLALVGFVVRGSAVPHRRRCRQLRTSGHKSRNRDASCTRPRNRCGPTQLCRRPTYASAGVNSRTREYRVNAIDFFGVQIYDRIELPSRRLSCRSLLFTATTWRVRFGAFGRVPGTARGWQSPPAICLQRSTTSVQQVLEMVDRGSQ